MYGTGTVVLALYMLLLCWYALYMLHCMLVANRALLYRTFTLPRMVPPYHGVAPGHT